MTNQYILSIDQGTTSSRAIVFTHSGTIAGSAQQEFNQIFPKPGWVEHDPMEIWTSQLAVIHDALKDAKIKAKDLVAIGITNQRETAVAWDKRTGKPLNNAIVWQDRRTAGTCDEMKAKGLEVIVREKTGLVIDAYFSATRGAIRKLSFTLICRARIRRDRQSSTVLAISSLTAQITWAFSI